MKRLALLLCLLSGVTAFAEEKKTYDTFKLVKTRNIFDPNRRPMREEEPRERTREFRTRPNWISLTGIMVTDTSSFAFFNSSRVDARKVASVGDTVGDYKVVGMTPSQVEWEREGNRSVLVVGRQIEISGTTNEPIEPVEDVAADGPPADATAPATETATPVKNNEQLRNELLRNGQRDRAQQREGGRGGRGDRGPTSRENGNGAPSSGASSTSSPAPSADQSEVLRKMMERRQKELSK